MMQQCYVLLFILVASTDAFMIGPGASIVQRRGSATTFTSTSSLQMAGFGAAPKKDKKKKSNVLKPKQQWDRFVALKNSESIPVAVGVVDPTVETTSTSDSQIEWLQVGLVRSKDNAFTEEAVMRQRLLISEHARRCYPHKIQAKDTLGYSYLNKSDQLMVVGKGVWGEVKMPADIEKDCGFVGIPDKTGFYARSSGAMDDKSVTKRVTSAPSA
jgi:hypothetical protein